LYEIGFISWSLSTGDFNKKDWFSLLFLGLIEFGLAPETNHTFHITPVDRISRSIVELGESGETIKATINLPETHTITFKAIWTEICRQQMMEPHYLDVIEWRQKLDEQLKTDSPLFHGLRLFSRTLTDPFSKDITTTIDTESDLNLPMFVKALLRK
jgi:thioester reductase-like protein